MSVNRAQQILYRDRYECVPKQPGCLIQAHYIELVYTVEELRALRRDPGNPDNWWSVCANCRKGTTDGQ